MTRPTECSQYRRGLSIVELLVTLAIAAVILGVVGAFFSFQARTSRDTQARNELNVRSRTVAEAVTQDLRMAGARAIVTDDGRRVDFRKALPCDVAMSPCLVIRNDPFELEVEYVSSLHFGGLLRDDADNLLFVCRRVVYRLEEAATGERMLFRSDRDCSEIGPLFDFTTQFAPGILGIDLEFVCGPDNEGGPNIAADDNPANCFVAPYSFIREAVVTVEAASTRGDRTGFVQLATSVPNARDPFRFAEP